MILPDSDDPARSSPHLWSYLTSPTRTEPIIGQFCSVLIHCFLIIINIQESYCLTFIIVFTVSFVGLSMITEYRNSNGQHSFLCSCCKVILATQGYMGHLSSSRHRFNYIVCNYTKISVRLPVLKVAVEDVDDGFLCCFNRKPWIQSLLCLGKMKSKFQSLKRKHRSYKTQKAGDASRLSSYYCHQIVKFIEVLFK